MRSNAWLVVAVASLAVFALLLLDVLQGDVIRIDSGAYRLFVQAIRSDALTVVMRSFSALSEPVVLAVMLLVLAAFAPGRRPGWCCAVNLALVGVLNHVIKVLVCRARPEGFRLAVESGFSFPSAHSMVAMAFFGLIIWLIWHYQRDRILRWLLCAGFCLVIVMIGVSRIYLGVHFATDVLGGFFLSLAWLALYTRFAVPVFLGDAPMPAAR
ncbi:phosphoesterase PA-phosphatase related protein [Coriobacterium glomerans PW2]|uniref:Phosphoesterase PA-phosphatase related protein n=2 Tax=Coriobacterium TaxID=33870 RepID=F2N7J7_CORGP|nr:phosphoesterase PA-phosphatase related protein [Coriobacterium glomerans PW2]